jgi:hypothetical protein
LAPTDAEVYAFASQPIPVRRGASWPLLLGAVSVAAILLGATVVVGLTGILRGDEPLPTAMTVEVQPPPRVEEAHFAEPKPIARADPEVDEEMTTGSPTKRRHADVRAATNALQTTANGPEAEHERLVTESAPRKRGKGEVTPHTIQARMDVLSLHIEALLKQQPELNQQLLGLKSKIAMNRMSTDVDRVDRELTKLEKELRELTVRQPAVHSVQLQP